MWTGRLLALNVLVFLLTMSQQELILAFALIPATVLREPWTLVTYMFLHGGFGHLFFNMLTLFFFGPRVEMRMGSRNFLRLYLASGLGGAVLSLILAPGAAVVGASGAIFGVLLAFAHFWPKEKVYLWMVLPVPARWLVVGMALISIYMGIDGRAPLIAHFAHLGGFVGGWAYLRWFERRNRAWQQEARANVIQRAVIQARADTDRWRSIRLEELHPINREEVERVLQKLETQGVASLTQDERAFLDRMS